MAEWVSLTSKAVLDEKVRALRRKCRGHYFSNYVWFSAAIEKEMPYSPMWLIEDNDNMLLLQQYNDFYKLFYFIGDVENLTLSFPQQTAESHVLCEYFEEEGKEKQEVMLNCLSKLGFSLYRKFYMWECEGVMNDLSVRNDLSFDRSFTQEQLKELIAAFDPFVDLIPLPELFEEYYNNKHYFVCYVDGDYAGVVVYTLKDTVIDEDLIYVKPQFRGIGKYLYATFLNHAINVLGCKKVVPWVHTDNHKSISFHTAAGAKQTPYYKLSFLTYLKQK